MSASPVTVRYYERFPDGNISCRLCPHACFLKNGNIGLCGARKNRNGALLALTYGEVTGATLDPVEKKPLYHFFPGRSVFSIGGWGCNLKCVFCQNSAISQGESATVHMTPRDVAHHALRDGSFGVAYTFNEPVIAIEFIIDCCKEVRKAGGKNILVTNGYINQQPLADLLPFVDAMNIDVKAFNNHFYKKMCGATLEPVLETVKQVMGKVHLELTTLIIPEANDAVPELTDLAAWIAETCGRSIPCHLTAYHPSYHYHTAGTSEAHLKNARYIFRKKLDFVYIGNAGIPGASDTICPQCGNAVVRRVVFSVDPAGMAADGTCAKCGAQCGITC